MVEKPGSFKGLVGVAAKRILPKGYELAADFAALKAPHPKLASRSSSRRAGSWSATLKCPQRFAACNAIKVIASSNKKAKKPAKIAKGKLKTVAGGKSKKLKLKLTGKGRKLLKSDPKLKLRLQIESAELAKPVKQNAKAKAKR